MDIGIGLPNPVPNADGEALLDFARRADARGFSTLATIGRVAYPSHDDLISLAAAAGATERIGLMTNILLAPTHEPALLAKQAASIDSVSGGRLTLGIAAGGRPDDYAAVGRSFADRGRRLDAAVEVMRAAWRGEPVTGSAGPITPKLPPAHPDGVPLVFGGTTEATIRRVVAHGIGWTVGGGGPEGTAPFVQRLSEEWAAAGRGGSPKLVCLSYFALGDRVDEGRAYLRGYYGFLGPYAEAIASSALASADAIRAAIDAYREVGFNEMILVGTVAHPDQVDLLADVVFAR
jgi:alkanesulfonate monooxygenase SsuD/methylene tetrahydromethanopterin reductase-like flavin-dependent oxidoreductase (luciferase family)